MTKAHLEAILFVSAKPLTVGALAKLLETDAEKIESWLEEVSEIYSGPERGMMLVRNGAEVQFFSAPQTREVVENFLKEEITGELTRPQLETLTIIAYRGPISKPDIEQIRGINCTLILRNLEWRGLIEQSGESTSEIPAYRVTIDFVRYLGLSSTEQLPQYEKMNVCEALLPSSQLPL